VHCFEEPDAINDLQQDDRMILLKKSPQNLAQFNKTFPVGKM
jgi:hypothetical protein